MPASISRRQLLTMLGVGGAAALLAACQGASPAAAAPAQPASGTAPAQAAAAQGTPSTARMRIDESSDVSTLNPLAVNSPPTRRRAVLLFSALYAYDAQNKLVPDLADGMPQ